MTDVVLGVLALVIGLLLCFRGHGAMRVLLAIWGAFVGFGLGATAVDALTDQGYLDNAAGWAGAIVAALIFAALAYLFYAVAIVLAFASMGFVLGATVAAALGAAEPWLITGVGVVGGLLLGMLAIATNLPQLVLIVLSAFAGASVAVGGLLLLLQELDYQNLTETNLRIADQPVWYLGQLALAVLGIIVQVRHARRRRTGTLRQSWGEPARS